MKAVIENLFGVSIATISSFLDFSRLVYDGDEDPPDGLRGASLFYAQVTDLFNKVTISKRLIIYSMMNFALHKPRNSTSNASVFERSC